MPLYGGSKDRERNPPCIEDVCGLLQLGLDGFLAVAFPGVDTMLLCAVQVTAECHRWNGTPYGVEGQALMWASAEDLGTLPMPPADVPLLASVAAVLQQCPPVQ
jgi:hypothetical protein